MLARAAGSFRRGSVSFASDIERVGAAADALPALSRSLGDEVTACHRIRKTSRVSYAIKGRFLQGVRCSNAVNTRRPKKNGTPKSKAFASVDPAGPPISSNAPRELRRLGEQIEALATSASPIP